MSKKLYYHKTSGGAEYLTDRWVKNPDGSKEGVFENASILVRIDGDITKDAEITLAIGSNQHRSRSRKWPKQPFSGPGR